MSDERVPKQIPLDCEFIADDSSAVLKPVIHELALVAKLDQRAVNVQRKPLDRNAPELALPEIAHLPAAAGRRERGECTASPVRSDGPVRRKKKCRAQ
jgi:hypothetical protein